LILKASQRGGAKQLGLHLLKPENDHVTVHEVKGFASDNVIGAMKEAYAISKGTRCKQHLFSVSLNPPQNENVPTDIFDTTIDRIEQANGLNGQPRIVVFHEKLGADGESRRHAHAVWSRIDADTMKARQLSFFKMKMREISRDLYHEHNWDMPKGLADSRYADPRNYSLVEYEQAKRQKHDPKAFKKMIQDCWTMSDNRTAFAAALEERGLKLAAGRRGHVAVDTRGEPYAISRYTGLKAKEVRSKLGETNGLPSVEKATALLTNDMHHTVMRYDQELQAKKDKQRADNEVRQQALVKRQQAERKLLKDRLEAQRIQESQQRQARLRTGMKGLWDRLTRERKRIQEQNEREAFSAYKQAQARKDDLIFRQQEEHRNTQQSHTQKLEQLRERQTSIRSDLERLRLMKGKENSDLRTRLERKKLFQVLPMIDSIRSLYKRKNAVINCKNC